MIASNAAITFVIAPSRLGGRINSPATGSSAPSLDAIFTFSNAPLAFDVGSQRLLA